jgi:hypothetical protein
MSLSLQSSQTILLPLLPTLTRAHAASVPEGIRVSIFKYTLINAIVFRTVEIENRESRKQAGTRPNVVLEQQEVCYDGQLVFCVGKALNTPKVHNLQCWAVGR